jgi:hypothetical protein
VKHALPTVAFLVLTTGCATVSLTYPAGSAPTAQPSLRSMAPPDAVLELIQRVMKAAQAEVMANEDVALKTLGLTLVPSTKPGGSRQIITGIAALDDDKEVRVYYGVHRDPSRAYKWALSILSFSQLLCIDFQSMEAKLGKPQYTVFPRHGERNGGWYGYYVYAGNEKIEATFSYRGADGTKNCLNDFSIHPIKR